MRADEMRIQDAELEMLKRTSCSEEWNSACQKIKGARNGNYPPDWWEKVMLTGLADSIMKGWNEC